MILAIFHVISYYPLNLFLGISSFTSWVYLRVIYFSIGLSPILFKVLKIFSLASPFVKGLVIRPYVIHYHCTNSKKLPNGAMLTTYFSSLTVIITIMNFCVVAVLSQWISMAGTSFSQVEISDSKFRRQLASSLAVASAIISDSIVDWTKIVCFLDFQATTPHAILKIYPLVAFESSEREFQ